MFPSPVNAWSLFQGSWLWKTPSDASSFTLSSHKSPPHSPLSPPPPPLPFSQSIKLRIPSVPSCSPCLSSAPQSPSSETSSGYSWKVFHLLLHQMMRQGRGLKILQHCNTEGFSSETFRKCNFPTTLQVAFKTTVFSLNTTVCCCRDPIE